MSGCGIRDRVPGWWLAALVGMIAVPIAAGSAAAQDRSNYQFVGGMAYERGGPGPALADGLDAIGYGDTEPGPCGTGACSGAVDFPSYLNEGLNLTFLLGLRYRSQAPVSFQVLISNGARGNAQGYDDGTGTRLTIGYASFLATPTVAVYLGPVRVQAGPVVNATRWDAVANGTGPGATNVLSLGYTAAAGVDAAVGETLVSLTAGGRSFPPVGLNDALGFDLVAEYRTVFIGVTVTPR